KGESMFWRKDGAMKNEVKKHLELLGTVMEDVVTGRKGMVSSVSFDAYGCVQATLQPREQADGSIPDPWWMDVKRLRSTGERVMPAPPHFITPPGEEIGSAEKPAAAR